MHTDLDTLDGDDLDQSLNDALDTADTLPGHGPGMPTVLTDQDADKAMRQLARVEGRRAAIRARRDALVAPIDAWAAREDGPLAARAGFLHDVLAQYALDVRDVHGRKSTTGPYGTVRTRETGAGWEVADEAAYVAWARTRAPQTLKDTTTVLVSEAKRVLLDVDGTIVTKDHEVVPGLKVRPAQLTATVTPDVDAAAGWTA